MKKVLLIIGSIVILSSCSSLTKVTDSEIDAIRDQTEVLKEQNKILKEISEKIK